MFGISGGEAILILVVALVVIGPERLPEYAEKLKDLIKALRRYATGAKDDLRETLGPEFTDVDWRKLDPRQYDPRVIVREALMEEDEPQTPEYHAASPAAPVTRRLESGERAPYDTEAT